MPHTLLKVPERGTVDVQKSVWSKVAADATFWQLVNAGIVTVEQGTATTVRLKGGCYVGRAVIGGHTMLQLDEKVPGSLFALIQYSSRAEFRIHRLPSYASEIGPLISLLIGQFNDAVSLYLTRGRQFTYRREQRIGTLIGGKLNLTGTIKLRSRGLRHLAQFEKNAVVFDTPVNDVILTALREVGRIHRTIPVDATIVARSRALALLFSDCRTAEVLFGARETFIRNAAAQEIEARDPLLRDLMALAGVLLSHESFEPLNNMERKSPRSWFLNLETLFELAVRNVLSDILRDVATVRNGRSVHLPIFRSTSAGHLANPDIVIRTVSGRCVIGDAKFKVKEDRSDLYQLLVHAATFGALTAFLVSPDDEYSVEVLGPASTGATVRRFSVDLRQLKTDLKQLASVVVADEVETGNGLKTLAPSGD